MNDDTALILLREWYDWWNKTDDAPVKMPKALHIRTAILLEFGEVKSDGTQPLRPVR